MDLRKICFPIHTCDKCVNWDICQQRNKVDVEIYEDTINPFDTETAKQFVYAHRNVFSDKVIRKVIYADYNLIVVKEIEYFKDKRNVWFWGFTRERRGIIKEDCNNKEAISTFKKLL